MACGAYVRGRRAGGYCRRVRADHRWWLLIVVGLWLIAGLTSTKLFNL